MATMEMIERKEPRLVQFAEGELVEGVMVSLAKVMVSDPNDPNTRKPVVKVLVEDDSGEMLAFLCTYDLLQKLHQKDIGHRIQVQYQGEDHTVRRGTNSLKKFRVCVSKNLANGEVASAPGTGRVLDDGTQITDSDIPF